MRPTALLLVAAASLLCSSPSHGLRIDRAIGSYEDIVVAIHPSVKPDDRIIENIKALFRSASTFLHRATRGLVHFGSVTIAIPETWPMRSTASNTTASLFPVADVHVEPENPQYGDRPYTLQPRGCGERGEYIHLTPRFLADMNGSIADTYGSPAYQLVHEWAHYRYGVFDEYGDPESHRYPSLYCEFGMVRASTCSQRIKFTASTDSGAPCRIYKGCRVSSDCKTRFSQNDKNPVTSSIMFMPYLKGVTEFCDRGDKKHNAYAPNKHNHLCDRKSTWEVISANDDFKGLAPADPEREIEVKFKEVQKQKGTVGRVILALDISASMNDNNRLDNLKAAATQFIQALVPDGLELGIVVFDDYAYEKSPLVPVNASTRTMFADIVKHLNAGTMTCIGCALKKALEMFQSKKSTEGSVIILMTDGMENSSPNIAQVADDLVSSQVVVNTIAFGTDADKSLEDLALRSGGRSFALMDGQSNVAAALESAFLDSVTAFLQDDDRRRVVIFDRSVKLSDKKEFEILVDADVGNQTTIAVQCSDAANLKAELRYPDGKACDDCLVAGPAVAASYITFKIPGIATPGTWTLVVTRSVSYPDVDVHVRATSLVSGQDVEPVFVRAFLKKAEVSSAAEAAIYAEVTKGSHVVLHARVTATVIPPKGNEEFEVQLFDDGLGADVTANDGIYSGYFTQFNGTGRYSVSARVVSADDSVIVKGRKASGSLPALDPSEAPVTSEAPESADEMEGIPLDDFVYVDEDIEVAEPHILASEKAPHFSRYAEAGSFRLTEEIDESRIPPGAIDDLEVEDAFVADNGTHVITLAWTCPGAHLDSGKPSKIELRGSTHVDDIVKKFEAAVEVTQDNATQGSLSAEEVRSRQRLRFSLPEQLLQEAQKDSTHDFYFSARSWNDDGLSSPPSNVARVTFDRPSHNSPKGGGTPWWVIFLSTLAVILVVGGLVAAAFWVVKRRRNNGGMLGGGQY
ncbi:calcium-activated chloride channel regulator 1-like [Amblyomma americanum]